VKLGLRLIQGHIPRNVLGIRLRAFLLLFLEQTEDQSVITTIKIAKATATANSPAKKKYSAFLKAPSASSP
jgi:hypothetical protein